MKNSCRTSVSVRAEISVRCFIYDGTGIPACHTQQHDTIHDKPFEACGQIYRCIAGGRPLLLKSRQVEQGALVEWNKVARLHRHCIIRISDQCMQHRAATCPGSHAGHHRGQRRGFKVVQHIPTKHDVCRIVVTHRQQCFSRIFQTTRI